MTSYRPDDDTSSDSDDDDFDQAYHNSDELDHKTTVTATSQSQTSSSFGDSYGHHYDAEWIQCKETDTGRTIWYNKETLMVTFENPILNNLHRGRQGSILNESIAREDIDDNLIPKYLLRFGSQQWDFRNDYVDVFRAQSARIDHTKLLPHPNDLVFPEFFSNHTIPKKETFLARILPPIEFTKIITSVSWKMSINVNKTTASDIIEKFVAKVLFFLSLHNEMKIYLFHVQHIYISI